MKLIYIIPTFICFLNCSISFGQTECSCDSIYNFAEKMPVYKNDTKGLADYLNNELIPILSDCYKKDSLLTASIYLTLTINQKGHVIDVKFERINASELCKDKLREKIMSMPEWTAGYIGGKAICCRYLWPISCIKWE